MTPQDSDATRKVVLAAMKVLYDKNTFQFLKNGLTKPGPLPDKLAQEAVGVLKLVNDRAQGKIPRQVLYPAAVFLVSEIARFMADAGLAKATPQDITAAIQKLLPMLKQAMPMPGAAPPAAPQAAPAAAAPQPGLMNQPAPAGA